MTQTIELREATLPPEVFTDKDEFALDVLVGLSETHKSLPSKYLYDERGCELFARITQLPEYYPTGCELAILRRHANRIAGLVPDEPFHLIEFGAGSHHKVGVLIEAFLQSGHRFEYIPIDIASEAIDGLANDLKEHYPDLAMRGIVSDYFTGIKWLNSQSRRRNLVLFLGSNIGNFSRAKAHFFLRNLWNGLNDGDLVMIGFDLRKDIELLLGAYNDSEGVTAEFNLNLLRRINRELGGQFDLDKFRHFATYHVFTGAMESYLLSQVQQEVFIEEIGRSFSFRPWEPIHMEYSYKYLESDIDQLASATGFVVEEHLYDEKHYFVDTIWRVKKRESSS
jgi:dimethylhistidine N-methyltransferase